ncbi:MAG: hypothetical protein OXC07_01740 [Kistimonas sp.]|nr:hypothetical protein [Kistimonas sp.]
MIKALLWLRAQWQCHWTGGRRRCSDQGGPLQNGCHGISGWTGLRPRLKRLLRQVGVLPQWTGGLDYRDGGRSAFLVTQCRPGVAGR